MIRTVILDLGGVIVPLDFATSYGRLSALSGHPVSEVEARIKATPLLVEYETGRITSAEFHEQFSREFGFSVEEAEFADLWCSLFPEHSVIPPVWLSEIRRQKRLLLLSNTNEIHFERLLKQRPYLADFDHHVVSYKAGAMKPDPAIYKTVLEHAECPPEECFFTDDVLKYVEGARAAGIDAEQFLGPDKLRADLAARGIIVSA
ncbi:haloacid dehalogenase [Bryobacterales bacterium F-183]|nr:haloacid dehalogenase [Bryobacterales bacterium F-183]